MKNNYKEICEEICEIIGDESIERMDKFEVQGIVYTYGEMKELDTIDEGKYQYGGSVYGIGLAENADSYYMKGEPLFYVRQDFTQTGSYYNSQEREYEKPEQVELVKKVIEVEEWERVE